MKAVDQDFEAAYRKAKKLTVFWCPIIDPSRLIKVPQRVKIDEIKHLIDGANELLSPNSVPPPLAERMTGIYSGLITRPTISGNPNIFAETAIGEDADDPIGHTIYRAQTANLEKYPKTYDFCLHPTAQANISFGLWQQRDDWIQGNRWIPEINICKTYSEKPQMDAFVQHLENYRETMGQASMHFKLDEQSWFYSSENAPSFERKEEVRWTLTTTQNDPWMFQFRAILERLNYKSQTDYPKMVLSGLKNPDGLQNLGATIEGAGDNNALRLSIGGCSSYLFRPFFEERMNVDAKRSLQTRDTSDYTDLGYRSILATSDAILLNVKLGDDREVLYAFYSNSMDKGSTPEGGRCLCGHYYPSHGDSPNSIAIANLRTEAAEWIHEQYKLDQDNRGKGWSWKLLSSPHFYFAPDPALLAVENKDEASRKKCEDEALSKAKNRWQELMADFFEGSNQNSPNPTDEKPPQE